MTYKACKFYVRRGKTFEESHLEMVSGYRAVLDAKHPDIEFGIAKGAKYWGCYDPLSGLLVLGGYTTRKALVEALVRRGAVQAMSRQYRHAPYGSLPAKSYAKLCSEFDALLADMPHDPEVWNGR